MPQGAGFLYIPANKPFLVLIDIAQVSKFHYRGISKFLHKKETIQTSLKWP